MSWKIAFLSSALATLGGGLALVGCGGDDCTHAEDHKTECAAATSTDSSSVQPPTTPACSGTYLCQSQCINQHTCTEINSNDPSFLKCASTCLGK